MGPPSPPRTPHPRGWRWRPGRLPRGVGVEETMPHHHGSALPVGWRLLFLEGRQAGELTWAAAMRPVAAADAAVIAERVPKSSPGLYHHPAWPGGSPGLPTAPLHQDRGSYLTITPSLCAWNSQPKSQAFPGLAFQRTPGTLTKGRDEKSVLFLQMQIPAESPACCRHRGGCGQAGAVSACLSPIPSSAHPAVTTPSPGLLLHLGFRSCSAPAPSSRRSLAALSHPGSSSLHPPMSQGRMRTQWSGLMGLSHPRPSTTWDECSPWGHSWDTHRAPHTDVTKGRLPVPCLQKPFGVGTIPPSSPTHPQLPSPQIYQRLKIFYTSP